MLTCVGGIGRKHDLVDIVFDTPVHEGSSINDVMPEGGRGGSSPHDQQC